VPENWQNLPSKALYGWETAWNTVGVKCPFVKNDGQGLYDGIICPSKSFYR
jgi:hypothetical protein